MSEAFKAGDKVVLKCGGPLMAVETVGEGSSPTVHCVWFDRTNSVERWTGPHRDTFNSAALMRAPDDAKTT